MANDQSKQLAIDVIARVDKLEKGLAKARKSANDNFTAIERRGSQMTAKLETTMAASAAKLGGIGKTLVTAFGFGALLGGLATLPGAVREVVRGLGDLADAADKIGMPVEELEAYRYGAQLAGIETASLDDALAKFTKTVGEAGAKGNDFSKILAQNGVALKDANGNLRPVTELLSAYADLIKNAATESDQMFLATTAFGRSGGDMVLMLRDGADGLDNVTRAAKEAGVVLGNDLVRAAADVDDAFDKLSMQMIATFETEVVNGIQTVQNLTDKFEALPGAIEKAWGSFEGFWNNLAGINPADVATQKLKTAMNVAAVNGTQPWKDGFSVQDMDFGPAAGKGDRLGAPPRKTNVTIPKTTHASTSVPKTADDRVQQSIQSIKDRTAALREELATMGLSFVEQTKRSTALDIEQEALKQVREEARKKGDVDWQNAQLSPAQVKAINDVSDAYAKQADQLRKAQDAQQLQRDVLQGVFDDLRGALDDGKLDWQDFGNIALSALDKIIDKVENDLINAIMNASGAGGGILGSLLGAVTGSSSFGTPGGFAEMLGIPGYVGGTNNHPGGLAIVGEKGPELLNLPRGAQVMPRVPSTAALRGGGGGGTQAVNININVTGANGDDHVIALVQEGVTQGIGQFAKSPTFTRATQKSLKDMNVTGVRF